MLNVLELFDENTPIWTADAVCERLKFSTSSGYRYLRELCDAALLTRRTGGIYTLGARIVELEYVLRTADPVAKVGMPILKRLAVSTGCDALLSNLHGLHIINMLHERGVEDISLTYVRGRQHPLFRGAVAKAILPFLRRARLVKIYSANVESIAKEGMGTSWLEFWRNLQAIKRQGFSESHEELDAHLYGLGVPVFVDELLVGSLTIVYSSVRAKVLSRDGLVARLHAASREMSRALQRAPSAENGHTAHVKQSAERQRARPA